MTRLLLYRNLIQIIEDTVECEEELSHEQPRHLWSL